MKELSFLALAAGLAAGAAGSAIAPFAADTGCVPPALARTVSGVATDPGTRCRCAPAVNREYSH